MSEQSIDGRKRLKAKLLLLVQTNPKFRRRVAAILRRKDAKKKEAAPNQDDSEPGTTGDSPMTSLKSDLIRLASTMEAGPQRTQLIQILVASKTLKGKKLKDLINRTYSRLGDRITINMMDIPKIWKASESAYVSADSHEDGVEKMEDAMKGAIQRAKVAASKDPDGGKFKDEGGKAEGSEDPGAGEEGPETSLGEGYEPGEVEEGKEGDKKASSAKARKVWKELSADAREAVLEEERPRMSIREELHDNGLIVNADSNVMKWTRLGREVSDVGSGSRRKAAALKIAHMPYLSQPGNLSREGIRGKGLTKAVIRSGDGFALYNIDAGRNHSKFYEGYINEQRNGMFDVVFRWGAMTDSGFTGRIDGRKYDEKFMNLSYDQAKRMLDKKKRAKIGGRGYVDTFGPKHKDLATGKKLKQGEYPIGLARDVGFGWGTQEMAYCVPALRGIAEEIASALDPNDGTDAVVDLKNALRLVRGVPDSSMAGKITKFIGVAMRGIARGNDQTAINKTLFTIKNYIDKQIALCPV